MRSIRFSAALILAAGAAHAAPLTYQAALALAEQSAPSLQARAVDVRAARETSIASGRLPDPRLRAGLENFPVSGPPAGRFGPESMTMATLGVMQDVPNSARRSAARLRAAADIGAAEAADRVEARSVRLSTALAWVDLYFARRRLAALEDIVRPLTTLREVAPSQLAAGAQRPAQALEAEQMAAALADRRADLSAAVRKAHAGLARWTGDADVDVAGAPPSPDVDPVGLRGALDRVPSYVAYDAIARQADADVAAAKADKRPDWSWELTYEHRDPRWGDMVSLGATVSLPLFGATRQDPMVAARALAVNRVRFEREAARRALTAGLETDLADQALHKERLDRARTTLEPLARRRADLEAASYAAGNAGVADLLTAQLALAESRIEILDREADLVRDAVRITLTYGADAS